MTNKNKDYMNFIMHFITTLLYKVSIDTIKT